MAVSVNSTSEVYGYRQSGGIHGDVFTSPEVVSFMLDLLGYTADRNLSEYRVLEPCFGDGSFLLEIQKRIILSAETFNFDATEVMTRNVCGCELDELKYATCIQSLKTSMPDYEPILLAKGDFLLSHWDMEFDFIIGNPPYVRYENLPKDKVIIYRNLFNTFHYRCDLYVLFYEHCLKYLAPQGKHCFICSNRWLKNKYGQKLRGLISSSYTLEYIIDVENLEAFKEHVLAYPVITVIVNDGRREGANVAVISEKGNLSLPVVTEYRKFSDAENWDRLFLPSSMEGLYPIEQQGFKVGIGVATGADKVFIASNLKHLVEEELLMPLLNARDLSGNDFVWSGRYLLNPYNANGTIVDLDRYPRAKQYLTATKNILERRHIVKNGRCWYALIDKVKPQLLNQPKILLPDISGNRYIFVDHGEYYPAHNLYYIIGRTLEELEILAAILMSGFTTSQIENISNKMNGGIPRWQSQSIRKIRIPKIEEISHPLRQRLLNAYHEKDFNKIDSIVDSIVKSQPVTGHSIGGKRMPTSIFDYDFS